MMVRYLVLHLLARLLHIQLEGNGQDEEEGIKVDMRIKTKKKRRQEVNDGKVENTGGVAAEGWKKGWEEEEEKSVENWTTLIGLELGARLARLENLFLSGFYPGLVHRLASRVEASLEAHQRHLEEAEAREQLKMEWQHAALVIDRYTRIVFVLD